MKEYNFYLFENGEEKLFNTKEAEDYSRNNDLTYWLKKDAPINIKRQFKSGIYKTYWFNDGSSEIIHINDIEEYASKNKLGYKDNKNSKSNYIVIGSKHDPYRGFNPALGCNIESKGHQKRLLKERNLVEIGNEKEAHYKQLNNNPMENYVSDKVIKDAVDQGANISGREATALKEGKRLHN